MRILHVPRVEMLIITDRTEPRKETCELTIEIYRVEEILDGSLVWYSTGGCQIA